MADKIADHFAHDSESSITAATASGINAVMLAQVSMLRLFAHSIERFAGNYQRAWMKPVEERSDRTLLGRPVAGNAMTASPWFPWGAFDAVLPQVRQHVGSANRSAVTG